MMVMIIIKMMMIICLPRLENNGSPIPGPLFDNGKATGHIRHRCPQHCLQQCLQVCNPLGDRYQTMLQLPQTLIYPRPNLLLRNKVHCTFFKPFWQYASPHMVYNLVYCCNTLLPFGVYGGAFSLLSVWNMVASVESTLQLPNRWSELNCAVSKLTENWPGLIVQGSSSSSV